MKKNIKWPLLSIVVPTYNSVLTIAETLESIVNQTYPNLEVLVVDGLSNDNTCEVVNNFMLKNNFIKLISEKDTGVYDAMNKGLKLSKGDFLYFMGSDDVFYNNAIVDKILTKENRVYDFIYGNVKFKKSKEIHSGESSLLKLIEDQISICHQAIFYSRSTFDTIGFYDLKYFIHADYDFNIRCFKNENIKIKFVDCIVAIFNEAGLSGLNSNADGFHTDLTEFNIAQKFTVLDLYNQKMDIERNLKRVSNSKEYRLGHLLLGPLKKIKKFLQKI